MVLPFCPEVSPLAYMAGRNYLLGVKYVRSIGYDSAMANAILLKKKYQATDVSMIPVPMRLSKKLHEPYCTESCPFFAIFQGQ